MVRSGILPSGNQRFVCNVREREKRDSPEYRERQRLYRAKWRAKNIERVRAQAREYQRRRRAAMSPQERDTEREATKIRKADARRARGVAPRNFGAPKKKYPRKRVSSGQAPSREAADTRVVSVHRHVNQDIPSDVRSAYKRARPGSQIRKLYPNYEALRKAAAEGKFDGFKTRRADVGLPL